MPTRVFRPNENIADERVGNGVAPQKNPMSAAHNSGPSPPKQPLRAATPAAVEPQSSSNVKVEVVGGSNQQKIKKLET